MEDRKPAAALAAQDPKARADELRRAVATSPDALAQMRALGRRGEVVLKEEAANKDLGKDAPTPTPDARPRDAGSASRERLKQLPGTERSHPPGGYGGRQPADIAAQYRGQEPAAPAPAAPQKQREERSH
ncbi:MAG TPA: hypothetical protein VD866_13035 [Urbifossiella sp.]|nr:hypothetical protein [Urbifossiella sp.]